MLQESPPQSANQAGTACDEKRACRITLYIYIFTFYYYYYYGILL